MFQDSGFIEALQVGANLEKCPTNDPKHTAAGLSCDASRTKRHHFVTRSIQFPPPGILGFHPHQLLQTVRDGSMAYHKIKKKQHFICGEAPLKVDPGDAEISGSAALASQNEFSQAVQAQVWAFIVRLGALRNRSDQKAALCSQSYPIWGLLGFESAKIQK